MLKSLQIKIRTFLHVLIMGICMRNADFTGAHICIAVCIANQTFKKMHYNHNHHHRQNDDDNDSGYDELSKG
ncbi:hypothetical protein DPMN_104693 [Dreissena polymorpha]|uniref:Uncharacterized protein n=1 Tax=Dreissena polymorpha TaxID=45954 RepID=A0A9D4K1C0_DREPO|nr:hypothetical protein DPMN_104693 [Dreissena polymorpha]